MSSMLNFDVSITEMGEDGGVDKVESHKVKAPKIARVIDITQRMADSAEQPGAGFVIVRSKDWFQTIDSVKDELCKLRYDGMMYDGERHMFSDWRKVSNGYVQRVANEDGEEEDVKSPSVIEDMEVSPMDVVMQKAAEICQRAEQEGWE